MKEDEDEMLLSPQAVASLFPSRVRAPVPSRESVLQRLSDAQIRRTLTKVSLDWAMFRVRNLANISFANLTWYPL
jgi:hypothetical protein